MKSQLAKYREALEDIITEVHTTRHDWGDNMDNIDTIAKEALKHEDTTCPKCGYPLFKHLDNTCCQGCDYVKQQ